MAPVGDVDFFRSFGVEPLAGRLFEPDRAEDNLVREDVASSSNPSIVINETGARVLGYARARDAVGQFASWGRIEVIDHQPRGFGPASSRIIGVVPDFSIGSVRDLVEPTIYYVDPSLANDLILSLDGHGMAQTVRAVGALWAKRSESVPLEGRFLSQYVNELYADVVRQATLFAAFSGVAVVVASLGLLGLAIFTAERRTREIGLRKAMGASRWDILCFLGWEFIRPVFWANLIAWPVAYLFTRRWLEGFAYHVDNTPFVFIAASAVGVTVALLTVAGHALSVARSAPAQALRHE
jgi:putative ABC transport system permease protein